MEQALVNTIQELGQKLAQEMANKNILAGKLKEAEERIKELEEQDEQEEEDV